MNGEARFSYRHSHNGSLRSSRRAALARTKAFPAMPPVYASGGERER